MFRVIPILIALLGLASLRAAAAPEEPVVWSVAGQQVLRLHAPSGGLSPARRVEELDQRLTDILSVAPKPIGPGDIGLRVLSDTVSITVNGRLLVTVTRADAAANHCSARRLGDIWLANVRKTVPLLNPRENRDGA